MPTFWISKYALTRGIYSVDCDDPSPETPGLIAEHTGGYPQFYHGEGKDWHRTRTGAVARAEVMRLRRINSLRMQITALEKLSFGKGD